jgi:hypothetical protein
MPRLPAGVCRPLAFPLLQAAESSRKTTIEKPRWHPPVEAVVSVAVPNAEAEKSAWWKTFFWYFNKNTYICRSIFGRNTN